VTPFSGVISCQLSAISGQLSADNKLISDGNLILGHADKTLYLCLKPAARKNFP
jgi:hypothetical protein